LNRFDETWRQRPVRARIAAYAIGTKTSEQPDGEFV
jgi:hypothetical protein